MVSRIARAEYAVEVPRASDVDPDRVFVAARQDGVVRAILQFVPWGADGMSRDVMRRASTADGGVNELMIVRALEAGAFLTRPELGRIGGRL